jgi:steroid delta-isomerase-like uncharacterized protein
MTFEARSRGCALLLVLAACGGEKPQPVEPGPAAADAAPAATAPAEVSNPAPTASTAEVAAAPFDLATAAKKYVADSTAAWASRDPKKRTALFTADAMSGIPGASGWEEAKIADTEKALGGYFAAFPDLKLTYTRIIGKGNLAALEWVFTGTNSGELMGQKPTNKKAGYRGVSLVTFAPDGKVKRESTYFDMGTMMGQLGMGPKGQPVRPVEAAPTAATEVFIGKDGDGAEAAARAWFATAVKGDAKALGALATDDIVVSNQYAPTDSKGKKALEKETAEGAKAFVDQKIDVVVCVPASPWVACEYRWTATWKGPAMGMKPTGKTGTVHSMELIELKDGKVAKTIAFANAAEFATAFGIGAEAQKADAKKPEAKKPETKKAP